MATNINKYKYMKRIVEKRVGGRWNRCQMKTLREGDVFRMFDTKISKRVGGSDYIAMSNAQLGINKKYPGTWGVQAKPHNN